MYRISKTGDISAKQKMLFTMDGKDIETEEFTLPTSSLESISNLHPGLFKRNVQVKYTYNSNHLMVQRNSKTFDAYNLMYFPGAAANFSMKPKNMDAKYKLASKFLIDSTNHNITAFYTRRDKAIKFNEFMDFEFTTYDQPDHILASFNLRFDYPRDIVSQHIVYSLDSNQPLGKLFVFGRRLFISKKLSDPEPNNHEIIFCDVSGNLVFHKTVKLRESTKLRALVIHGSAGDNKQIVLHYNFHEDQSMIGMVKFDYNGNHEMYSYPKADLAKMQSFIRRNASMAELDLTRKEITGLKSEPGINLEFPNEFKLLGAKQLSGDILLYGQVIYLVDDPNFVPPTHPDGRINTNATKPKISLHGELVFFRYNSDYSLVNAYIQELPLSRIPYQIHHVNTKNNPNSLTFFLPIPTKPIDPAFKDKRCMTNGDYKYHDFSFSHYLKPLIIQIGPKPVSNYVSSLYLFDYDKGVYEDLEVDSGLIVAGFGMEERNAYFIVEPVYLGD